MRITKTLVDTTPCPEKGQVILRDSSLPGFGLRLTPTCKSFIVEGVVNGSRKRVTIGRYGSINLEDARAEAQRILTAMAEGKDPTIPAEKPPTLAEVMDRFLQERAMKPETKKTYRSLVERSMPDWLKLPVNALSKEMILNRHQSLVKPTRCGTDNKSCANSAMQVLRVLMNFAAAKYDLAGLTNPTEALKYRWFRQEARQGVIPDSKLRQFYEAVIKQPKIARDFILLLLFTALRRSEGAGLKWTDIDFEASTLIIEADHNKSNRVHTLPLTPITTAILQSRLPAESEFVFPGRYEGHINEPRAVLAHLRQEMGWNWILHDLRSNHEFRIITSKRLENHRAHDSHQLAV